MPRSRVWPAFWVVLAACSAGPAPPTDAATDMRDSGCLDAGTCGPSVCMPGASGACASSTELEVCAADGDGFTSVPCPPATNASGACESGACGLACDTGYGDCDGDAANGCESDLRTSASCGRCENACASGTSCLSGVCADVPTRALAAGSAHVCARRATGAVACWGWNGVGQLGDGSTADSSTPVTVSGLAGAVQLAAGIAHTCAGSATGTIVCWGFGESGELGNGSTASASTPVAVSDVADAVQTSAGGEYTCARRATGAVACWGRNVWGALGNGSFTSALTPVAVSGLADAADISAGFRHACARRSTGTVVCWGSNFKGQLGNGVTGDYSLTPVAVSALTDAVEVSAAPGSGLDGWEHTCARRATGAVVCWGSNSSGQLGNGLTTDAATPVPVSGVTDAVEIAAGGSHTCARRATGAVACWGDNSIGQLGDGAMTDSSTPVAVSGLTDAEEIAAGHAHTCARRATGAVVCWGRNLSGQLGDGTTIDRPTPVSVVGFP